MYTSSFSLLPSKKQSSGAVSQNLEILRNLSSKSFSKFEGPPPHFGFEYKPFEVKGQSHCYRPKTSNIMNLMYNLSDPSRDKLRNTFPAFSNESNGAGHCKEFGLINNYSNVPTMPSNTSYLVGGFVGSKSQLCRRPVHGLGVKMWDIIREFIDIFGNASPPPSTKNKSSKSPPLSVNMCTLLEDNKNQDSKLTMYSSCSPVEDKDISEMEKPYKQTYADVTKKKLPIIKETSTRTITTKPRILHNSDNLKCCSSDMSKSVPQPICSSNYYPSSRDRITSECSADSEDSFIVFEYCEGDDNSMDYGDDSDSDDEESLYGNEELSSECGSAPSSPEALVTNSSSKQLGKRVRFAEGKDLAEVHKMVAWDYAYRSARRGPWEMLARDSDRFRCRIANMESVLGPVLSPYHRDRVFNARFTASDPAS